MTRQLIEALKGAMSQEDFAARIGVSQAQVSRVLAGGDAGRRFIQGLIVAFPDQREQIVAGFFASDYADVRASDTQMIIEEPEQEPTPEEAACQPK